MLRKMVHFKCRNGKYPFSDVQRLLFSDELTPWDTPFEKYHPPEYTSANLKNKPYADPDYIDANFKPIWNKLDGLINRKSYEGVYKIVDGKPLNPGGRTGLSGRGVLGRWGPNHAADPIVTRWKRIDGEKVQHSISKLPILQFCAIQRRDCKEKFCEWAIPGGMIDPGEQVSETLRREFMEEALNSLEANPEQVEKDKDIISNFFKTVGEEIYKGYVDDHRNTDNAWLETVAFNFHDDAGNSISKFSLKAGDDAKDVKWVDIDQDELRMYASHADLIKKVTELRKSHW